MSGKNSSNYSGPSQEYSPGDIDPVTNHTVTDVTDSGQITDRALGPDASLTGSAVSQFGRYDEAGNKAGYGGLLGSFGSGYGDVMSGYGGNYGVRL